MKEVVFELKRDFNKEFVGLERAKNDAKFAIEEKNEQIKDLLESLNEEIVVEQFVQHPLENPEHIFELDEENEIKVERFYNAQQRAERAEAERKRLEKEALLQGDNIGQRGLKKMLGGNELIFKKEKNKLEDELVREEWMNKPEEEMNEDEKQRLKEFEQRVEDSKAKQRKQWQVNLQRVRNEISEIKSKFEEQIYQLQKKRIFYDARIYEQELQIVRLTIALHDVKETGSNVIKFRDQLEEEDRKLEEQKKFLHICNDQFTEFDAKMKGDRVFIDQEARVKSFCNQDKLDFKKIMHFVKSGRPHCKVVVPPEKIEQWKAHICVYDPYNEIDAAVIDHKVAEEEKKEVYDFDRDRHIFTEVHQHQFENIVHERTIRMKCKQVESENQERLGNLRDFIHFLENEKKDVFEKFDSLQNRYKKSIDRQEKLKFNFEAVVFLKQGQVEVPQLPVATDYKDAILINLNVIKSENDQIRHKGNTKVN